MTSGNIVDILNVFFNDLILFEIRVGSITYDDHYEYA